MNTHVKTIMHSRMPIMLHTMTKITTTTMMISRTNIIRNIMTKTRTTNAMMETMRNNIMKNKLEAIMKIDETYYQNHADNSDDNYGEHYDEH